MNKKIYLALGVLFACHTEEQPSFSGRQPILIEDNMVEHTPQVAPQLQESQQILVEKERGTPASPAEPIIVKQEKISPKITPQKTKKVFVQTNTQVEAPKKPKVSSAPKVARGAETKNKPKPTAAPEPVEGSLAYVLEGLENRYKDTSSVRGHFRQIIANPSLGTPQEQSGSLYLMQPSYLRWDIQAPMEQSFYSDGQTMSVWNPFTEQLMIDDVGQQSQEIGMLLTDLADLEDKYRLKLTTRAASYVLRATPPKEEGVQFIDFYFSKKDFSITRIYSQIDTQNTVDLYVDGLSFNTLADARIFAFSPPAGAEIIRTSDLYGTTP